MGGGSDECLRGRDVGWAGDAVIDGRGDGDEDGKQVKEVENGGWAGAWSGGLTKWIFSGVPIGLLTGKRSSQRRISVD